MKNVLKENNRLLTQALSVDIVNIIVHDNVKFMNVDRNTSFSQESAPTFVELFEINDLKAQSQAKDTVILKLREKLQSLTGDVKERKVKREIEEIETLNIELDHRVTKLVAENEHLKQTYKQLYDSIKPSCVRSKEQSLKESLSKLKGKDVINEVVPLHSIDPKLLKIDVAPLALKLRVNLLSSASGSKSQDNTKNDRIQRTSRKAKKNKLEEHLRTVRPILNKKSVVDTKATSSVPNFMSNVNSDLKCTSCNGCLFSDNHDACVVALATTTIVTPKEPIPIASNTDKPVVQIVLWYLDSGCSKHMTGDHSQLINFVQKFLCTVKFRNDHVAKIIGYGDYQIGNVTISRVYYVEGLGHNLFSVGQFCDSDLKVAFCQHTYFIRNLDGASKTKSWLWHRRLSHLNFGEINHLARQGLVRGLPKLKFKQDNLCSACAMGKSMKKSHKPKTKDTNQEKLYLLHMDLCGPMRVERVNGKKYILVPVRRIRTDNGTEFVNQTLRDYYEEVGISHETSVARSSQQNGVVERLRTWGSTRRIVETIHVDFDEITTMASEQSSSGPVLNEMTPATVRSRLVQKPSSSTPYVPPFKNDWDLLFQPMFDELLNPPPSVGHQAAQVIASIAEVIPQVQDDSIGLPSSIMVDQDAPSASKSHTTIEIQSSVIPQEVEEDNIDIEVAHMGNDPLLGVTKVILLGLESVPLASCFVSMRGFVINKILLGIFHEILSVVGTTADLTRESDFVHLNRLLTSKMSFHQALVLIFELDETTIGCTQDILRQRDCLDRIDMVKKDLDLEPKIDAMMRDFLE
nr:hypothetical protein [Tanacetum cinerariifolium]